MTKGELLRFLEPFGDDIEIFVNMGLGHDNLTIVSAIYHYRKAEGLGEV